MKNLPTILSSVALAGVIALAVLYFLDEKETSGKGESSQEPIELPSITGGIVYVNIDSVLSNYDMYTDAQLDFQAKAKTSEARLTSQQNALQKDAQDFQYKIDRQLITRAEAEKIQQELMLKEQSLYQLQQSLQLELTELEQVTHRKVLNSIMEYLEDIEEADDYQYILGTTFGGNVLYANENLNITKAVVQGINEQYNQEKEDE